MFEQVEFILSPVAVASRGRERLCRSVSRTGQREQSAVCRPGGAGAGGAILCHTPGTRELQPAAGQSRTQSPSPDIDSPARPAESEEQSSEQSRLVRSCQAETPRHRHQRHLQPGQELQHPLPNQYTVQ